MSFLSNVLKNKGYLINTVDSQGLKCLKLLREEKQLCVRVCKLTRGSRIEGSPHSIQISQECIICCRNTGSWHSYPGICPDIYLGWGPET